MFHNYWTYEIEMIMAFFASIGFGFLLCFMQQDLFLIVFTD